jgi:hypothetical protein
VTPAFFAPSISFAMALLDRGDAARLGALGGMSAASSA